MAITQVNGYSLGDIDLTAIVETLDKTFKGKAKITISEYDTDAAPVVEVGSIFECNGALFKVDSGDETPSGYGNISNSTAFYLYFSEDEFVYSENEPTWNDDKQGWYHGNDRAFFSMYKSGSDYETKVKLVDKSELKISRISEGKIVFSGYSLRDTGPAGGLIFYDKGSYSDGWRYLECAPVSTEVSLVRWMSGDHNYESFSTGTAIGTGYTNTILVLAGSDATADYYPSAFLAARAVCYGGHGDWFLPSKDELNEMYDELHLEGFGGFANAYYWSSSEHDGDSAWSQSFATGYQGLSHKYSSIRVRAIRAF